jgi:hypothetical protein
MPASTAATTGNATIDCRPRALMIWPGLDRDKLRRTHGDPVRVARLVEQRTRLPIEAIIGLLTGRPVDAGAQPSAAHEDRIKR